MAFRGCWRGGRKIKVNEMLDTKNEKICTRSRIHLPRSPAGFLALPNTLLDAFTPFVLLAERIDTTNPYSALRSMSSIVSGLPLRSKSEDKVKDVFVDWMPAVVVLPFQKGPGDADLPSCGGSGMAGSGKALELGTEGYEELAECGMDAFVCFFELLNPGVCECEDDAVYEGENRRKFGEREIGPGWVGLRAGAESEKERDGNEELSSFLGNIAYE